MTNTIDSLWIFTAVGLILAYILTPTSAFAQVARGPKILKAIFILASALTMLSSLIWTATRWELMHTLHVFVSALFAIALWPYIFLAFSGCWRKTDSGA